MRDRLQVVDSVQELLSSCFPWSREWLSCCLEGCMDRAVPPSKPPGLPILNLQDADMFVLAFKQDVGFKWKSLKRSKSQLTDFETY